MRIMKSKFISAFALPIICLAVNIQAINFGDYEKERDEFIYGQFPKGFKWGFSTSSYQIEGGWNSDGKGENIWDEFTHRPDSIVANKDTGDVACDSYNKYAEDVKLLKNTGANFYRFSISWARILPLGTLEKINQPGVDYYNNLINLLLKNNIKPIITMYHWDLPQKLQDNGGWLNETIVEDFGNYARLLYKLYGDRVKDWITHNEPHQTCFLSYGLGILAPGILEPLVSPYECTHNALKGHAKAYRIYEREFKAMQKGRVGINAEADWEEPARPDNPDDVIAAERALQFRHGWFIRPIFFGDYPDIMRTIIDEKSKQEGRNASRLPYFDDFWTKEINGSWDFLGMSHYTSRLVFSAVGKQISGVSLDTNIMRLSNPFWPSSPTSVWLKKVPWGIRRALNWIKNTYGNPEVLIAENGWGDDDQTGLEDEERTDYYRTYINEVLKAVTLDGCNVSGYAAWSLLDNFEWTSGYASRFGVHYVNFTDPSRPRTPKKSAKLLTQIFADNGFPEPNNSI